MPKHIVTLKTCQGFQKFVRLADGSYKPYHEHSPPVMGAKKEGHRWVKAMPSWGQAVDRG
jgi:hypothetical protein